MRFELLKSTTSAGNQNRSAHDGSPRYSNNAPAYTLLPQNDMAPLAEQETYNENVYGAGNINAREIQIVSRS